MNQEIKMFTVVIIYNDSSGIQVERLGTTSNNVILSETNLATEFGKSITSITVIEFNKSASTAMDYSNAMNHANASINLEQSNVGPTKA